MKWCQGAGTDFGRSKRGCCHLGSLSAGEWAPSCPAVFCQKIQAAVLWKGPLSRTWETLGTRGFLIRLSESRMRGTGNFHRPWQTPAITALLEEFCFLVSDKVRLRSTYWSQLAGSLGARIHSVDCCSPPKAPS